MSANEMPIVYVAGPFRGPHHWSIAENVRAAERIALMLWRYGCAALCPHLNTMHFQGVLPDEIWLEGDLVMLSRCDACYMVPGWEKSEGAKTEKLFCERNGIPVFTGESELNEWLTKIGRL